MSKTHENIADLVADTIMTQKPIGTGKSYIVFPFADEAFKDYAIRLPLANYGICTAPALSTHEALKKHLLETSVLSSRDYGLNQNFGQDIMRNDTFSIVQRIPGDSLQELRWQYRTQAKAFKKPGEDIDLTAEAKLLKTLAGLPPESYEHLMHQFTYLTSKDAHIDAVRGNVMLDSEGMLRWIDVLHRGSSNSIADVIGGLRPPYTKLPSDLQADFDIFCDKLTKAGEKCGVPAYKPPEAVQRPVLTGSTIEGLTSLTPDQAPQALLHLLDKTVEKLGFER